MRTQITQCLALSISWIGLTAPLAPAESFPRAWNYVAADSTAIIGVEWQQLRQSFLSDAVWFELSGDGRLGFPDLACLRDAREIVLAGPDLLGIVTGSFPAAIVAAQASALGLSPADYDGVRLWIGRGTRVRSLAQVNDTLLLIGFRETLEAALDRSLLTAERHSSPLLARAARQAATFDLWIAASSLPDPLVSVFIPVDLESGDFDGGVSTRHGLLLDARYDMLTPEDAKLSADYFRDALPGFQAILHGMNVIEDGTSVRLKLRVAPENLAGHLRPPAPAPAKAATPRTQETGRRRSVRILGLDDGPREIPFAK